MFIFLYHVASCMLDSIACDVVLSSLCYVMVIVLAAHRSLLTTIDMRT